MSETKVERAIELFQGLNNDQLKSWITLSQDPEGVKKLEDMFKDDKNVKELAITISGFDENDKKRFMEMFTSDKRCKELTENLKKTKTCIEKRRDIFKCLTLILGDAIRVLAEENFSEDDIRQMGTMKKNVEFMRTIKDYNNCIPRDLITCFVDQAPTAKMIFDMILLRELSNNLQ